MITLINTHLGENRGVARVWLEGRKLAPHFEPGQKLAVTICHVQKKVRVVVSEGGEANLSVSRREKYGKILPLIEIKNAELSKLYAPGMLLRVVVKHGEVLIEAHGHTDCERERLERINNKLANGEPLAIASLFSGGGIIDAAIHEGLSSSGVKSYTKFAIEREPGYLDAMVGNQPELFRTDSIIIESAIERVQLRNPPKCELVIAGIPCTGASKAGKTKNKISAAEFHDDAGACFFYALQIIGACQPAVIVIENVPDYRHSTSMAVICSVLTTWGYDIEVEVLNGVAYGSLENRDRMCLVATTKGLDAIALADVAPVAIKPAKLGDVLETDIPLDSEVWRSYDHLVAKEVRDKADGKGFKRTLLDGSESHVPTIRRLYHKAGSTDSYVIHPERKELSRLLTPREHALIKGVPLKLIDGMCNTTAHEILGQSVCYPVFQAVGRALGMSISSQLTTSGSALFAA